MIKKTLSLVVLAVLLSSCATKNYGAVDLAKLHNNDKKYGIVVFRSMFFENEELVRIFNHDENAIKLACTNQADLFAQDIKENYSEVNIYQISGSPEYSPEWKDKHRKFTIEKAKVSLWERTPEILMPKYFYTVRMLPEGKYYISKMLFDFKNRGYLERHFNLNDAPYYFVVHGDRINYIGDLYFLSPEKKGFWGNKYTTNAVLLEKPQQAHEFIRKFYPEIDLPFITNLLINNKNEEL